MLSPWPAGVARRESGPMRKPRTRATGATHAKGFCAVAYGGRDGLNERRPFGHVVPSGAERPSRWMALKERTGARRVARERYTALSRKWHQAHVALAAFRCAFRSHPGTVLHTQTARREFPCTRALSRAAWWKTLVPRVPPSVTG